MKKQRIVYFIILFLLLFSSVSATSITYGNVWYTTAKSGDIIDNSAWNRICGTSEPSNGLITATEWNTCSGDNKSSGNIITYTMWNNLVKYRRQKRQQQLLEEMGCSQTISLGGLEVCSSNSTLNTTWAGSGDYSLGLVGGYYTWNAAQMACQHGYHLPTREEWGTLLAASSSDYPTLRSNLGLPLAGLFVSFMDDLGFHYQGTYGEYWSSSSLSDTQKRDVFFYSSVSGVSGTDYLALGLSVRCIKD